PVRNEPPTVQLQLPLTPAPPTAPTAGPPVVVPPGPPSTPPGPPPKPPGPPEKLRPEIADVELTQSKLKTLRLGVNGRNYDDVGAILDSLGKGYAYTKLSDLDMENADRLKEFDVVFLNCGGPVGRKELSQPAIHEFVTAGKTLYASDLQYDFVRDAFP